MQVALGKQFARQAYAFLFVLNGHLLATHFTGAVRAVTNNLHPAHSTTAAPAAYRNAFSAELFHGLENITLRRAGEFLTGIFNDNYKFFCHRAHKALSHRGHREHRVVMEPAV